MQEIKPIRAISFFDGQNIFRQAKEAFSYHYPNYDPKKLASYICKMHGFDNHGVRFYTGTPLFQKSPMWHKFWTGKLLAMRRSGVIVESRPLRYRHIEGSRNEDDSKEIAQEKGIDIRIALDIVRMTIENKLDVAVIFSQDQDLAEVVRDVNYIAELQKREVKIFSAFPSSVFCKNQRGVNGTQWIKIIKDEYDLCLDDKDYR